MPRIPFRPSMLKVRRSSIRWIIIHHTAEIYDDPASRIDNSKYQMDSIFTDSMILKQPDVNYHYVIDKIKDEYVAVLCRPYVYECSWPDIHPDINKRALHVALLGNYDFKVPPKRLYDVLSYRILNPFIKLFKISDSRILFHHQVSNNDSLTCPGVFLNHEIVISMTRKYVVK